MTVTLAITTVAKCHCMIQCKGKAVTATASGDNNLSWGESNNENLEKEEEVYKRRSTE